MCHNHSHFKAAPIGVLQVGNTALIEYTMLQPLAVELPSGERWIRPATTSLYLPVSRLGLWQVSTRQAMEVSYISLSNMEDGATMPTHETLLKATNLYGFGGTVWPDKAKSLTNTEGK